MKSNITLAVENIIFQKDTNLLPDGISNFSFLLSQISLAHSEKFPQFSIDWLEFGARLLLFLLTMINTVFDMKNIWNEMSQVDRAIHGVKYTSQAEYWGFTLGHVAGTVNQHLGYSNSFTMKHFLLTVQVQPLADNTIIRFPTLMDASVNSSTHLYISEPFQSTMRQPISVGLLFNPIMTDFFLPAYFNNLTNSIDPRIHSDMIVFDLADWDFNSTVNWSGDSEDDALVHIWYEHRAPLQRVCYDNQTYLQYTRCVFWKNVTSLREQGEWSSEGCWLLFANSTHSHCACSHFSSFSLLMDIYLETESDSTLQFVTLICSGSSVICLLITCIVLLLYGNVQQERTCIGQHQSCCLLLAHCLLIFLMDRNYLNLSESVCSVVAVSLHFLFLSAMFWTSMEGHYLYLHVVHVFGSKIDLRIRYTVIAYGMAVVIVAITSVASVLENEKAYGHDNICWLTTPKYIWAFIAPGLLLTLGNICVLILAFRAACGVGLSSQRSHRENLKVWLKGWFTLSALLGVSWIFGLVYLDYNVIFSYLFVLLNGCQGVFLLLTRCIFNTQIRKAWLLSCQRGFYRLAKIRRKSNSDFGSNIAISTSVECGWSLPETMLPN